MAEKVVDRKHVASCKIYEVPTADGARDHEVELEISMSGLAVRYNTTFDQVRRFFTETREKGKAADLKVVK